MRFADALIQTDFVHSYVCLGKITHTEYCQLGEDLERIGQNAQNIKAKNDHKILPQMKIKKFY